MFLWDLNKTNTIGECSSKHKAPGPRLKTLLKRFRHYLIFNALWISLKRSNTNPPCSVPNISYMHCVYVYDVKASEVYYPARKPRFFLLLFEVFTLFG